MSRLADIEAPVIISLGPLFSCREILENDPDEEALYSIIKNKMLFRQLKVEFKWDDDSVLDIDTMF